MVRHTLKISQHMLRDFKSVSDDFGTLCIKGLSLADITIIETFAEINDIFWKWYGHDCNGRVELSFPYKTISTCISVT